MYSILHVQIAILVRYPRDFSFFFCYRLYCGLGFPHLTPVQESLSNLTLQVTLTGGSVVSR